MLEYIKIYLYYKNLKLESRLKSPKKPTTLNKFKSCYGSFFSLSFVLQLVEIALSFTSLLDMCPK